MSTTAAAPSLIPLALAAVTVPSLSNAGFSLGDRIVGHAVLDVLVVGEHRLALARL